MTDIRAELWLNANDLLNKARAIAYDHQGCWPDGEYTPPQQYWACLAEAHIAATLACAPEAVMRDVAAERWQRRIFENRRLRGLAGVREDTP